ncbi:ABC transporter ATP-binding protein [Microbulbifer celer]|uniref:ATP-binding cassette domain-containing protein n=1 Tax=Microbulbifer celer TaxID=435905 RepID=A0ABW3U9Q4_9GAMM|nr:ATP-binding cassette domain-containing protein [Microbulbifer celer]UFN57403.1 ATP-binding cassette domain-containing protein [Microbulbifer celer]
MTSINLTSLEIKRSGKSVVRGLNFVSSSSRVRVTGVNGAGKTTLLLALAGLIPVASGSIFLEGSVRPSNRRKLCGFFSSAIQVPGYLTVAQTLSFFDPRSGCHFEELESSLLRGINFSEKYEGLSEGQKRRVSIVCAVRKERGVLIMDEPFNALDGRSVAAIENYLESYEGKLIYVDHRGVAPPEEVLSL